MPLLGFLGLIGYFNVVFVDIGILGELKSFLHIENNNAFLGLGASHLSDF